MKGRPPVGLPHDLVHETKVRTLEALPGLRGGRLLCGAGGGEVLRVGSRLRFYFHAWKGGTEATGGRRAPFMAVLRWRHGRPVVAKHR